MHVDAETISTRSSDPVRLTAPRIGPAIEMMARAFEHDPMLQYILPDASERVRLLPWFVGTTVRYGHRYGEVYVTAGLVEGVAIWLPPGQTVLTFSRMLRAGMLAAPLKFGLAGFGRFNNLVSYVEAVHKRVVPERHWYLWGLGVEPARQGQGIGGELIRPVLARADAAGVPCYLETMNERNLRFYRRHGFDVAVDSVAPKGGPRVWAMLRTPH